VSAIQVEGLTKVYGSVRALDGLDLHVEPGTVFGFLGPNGAGKTTTLRILTGLARPTSGKAWVAGIDLSKDGHSLASHVGHMPEEPAFYSWMTPREFLEYIGRLGGLSAADRAARAKELLELVHLADVRNRRIGGFSRGMRQRLALGAALIQRPEVLFLDEPVSALDPAGRKEVLQLIDTLRGQCTVLMSTHILADVERICDVIGIIAKGKLIVQSEREALLNQYATPVFELVCADGPALAAWAAALQQYAWVTSSSVDGDTARVVVNDPGTAKRGLLASAVQADLAVERFEEIKPSLEDVFLQLVGAEEQI
jgi:ABC-2 type transport system ATP-binding protein